MTARFLSEQYNLHLQRFATCARMFVFKVMGSSLADK